MDFRAGLFLANGEVLDLGFRSQINRFGEGDTGCYSLALSLSLNSLLPLHQGSLGTWSNIRKAVMLFAFSSCFSYMSPDINNLEIDRVYWHLPIFFPSSRGMWSFCYELLYWVLCHQKKWVMEKLCLHPTEWQCPASSTHSLARRDAGETTNSTLTDALFHTTVSLIS